MPARSRDQPVFRLKRNNPPGAPERVSAEAREERSGLLVDRERLFLARAVAERLLVEVAAVLHESHGLEVDHVCDDQATVTREPELELGVDEPATLPCTGVSERHARLTHDPLDEMPAPGLVQEREDVEREERLCSRRGLPRQVEIRNPLVAEPDERIVARECVAPPTSVPRS